MLPLNEDDDEPTYDDPTAEELQWQAMEARLEEYHAECWESSFGEILDDIRQDAMSGPDFSHDPDFSRTKHSRARL